MRESWLFDHFPAFAVTCLESKTGEIGEVCGSRRHDRQSLGKSAGYMDYADHY
jgi:hypothetical protein